MSNLETKAADMAGPIMNRVFPFSLGSIINLSDYAGQYITLIPDADATLLLAPTYAEASAINSGTVILAPDGTPTPDPTLGADLAASQRIDFRLPTRLGSRGEVFLGTIGTGTMQCWISSHG